MHNRNEAGITKQETGKSCFVLHASCFKMTYLFAIFSGAATIFVFPYSENPDLPYLGWIAWFSLVPLFYAIIKSKPAKSGLLGFITAFIYYSGSLNWMYTAVHDYAKYPVWASLLMIFFCVVVLSFFVGISCFTAKILSAKFRISLIFSLPFTWTLIDYVRTLFPFNGFPWNSIAYSQYLILPVIQIADITGVYGITFLIILINVSIAWFIFWIRDKRFLTFDKTLAIAFLLLVFTISYGLFKIHFIKTDSKSEIDVAIMHGATPQKMKNNLAEGRRQIAVFSDLSKQAVQSNADILIWPETIYIGPALIGKRLPIPIEEFGRPLILGAMTYRNQMNVSNSAVLTGSDGLIKAVHSKMHLVPFGEYVPKGFFFLKKLVGGKQKIIPGDDYNLFDLGKYRTGVLICYEDIFPDIARKFTKKGADFLTVISNDGWFEGTSASIQHLAFSVLRSVENRRFLVRSSNRGSSAFISPTGRIIDSESALTEVSLLDKIGLLNSQTIYTRFGDWFIWFLVVLAVVIVIKNGMYKITK